MDISGLLTAIDQQLAALQSARTSIAALASLDTATPARRGPGRPPKNPMAALLPKQGKRKLSAAGRARIAEAQKARWAAKKAIADPATKKVIVATATKPKKTTAPMKNVSKKAAPKKATP